MSTNDVIVRLRAVGQAAFEGAMQGAAKSVSGVGDAADHTAKETDKLTGSAEKSGKTFRQTAGKIAKWAATAAVVGKAVGYMHSAIETTEGLAKGTARLTRTTGMDAEAASSWAEIVKVRGVETNSFQRGLVALSRQMVAAGSGTKSTVKMFDDLGVSMDAIKSGNTQAVMLQMADGLKNMKNPALRAAYAQKLLGRQGQELLPLFSSGSAAIQEQLDTAKRYGAVIGTEGVGHAKEMAQQQRELKMATDGLKISLGEALVPVMLQVTTLMTQFAAVMQPVLRNSTALKVIIGLLAGVFVAYKVAVIASTIASMGMLAVWVAIPLAVAAIVVGLVLLWKKTTILQDAFRAVGRAAAATWGWIKSHWPLLLAILGGPFTLLPYLVVKKVKAVRDALNGAIGFFREWGGKVVHAIADGIKSAPGLVLGAIKSLLPGGLAKKVGNALKFWQHGGVVPHGHVGVVGERGPELVQLPGGTRITPLPAPALRAPALAGASAAMGRPVIAQVYLDRRMIATAVAEDTADLKARR